jgi:5-methylcytosine-specific restriction endonuclease McrA
MPYVDPERAKEYLKGWYERNRERCLAQSSLWYQRNRDNVAARQKNRRATQPSKSALYSARHRAKHLEAKRQQDRASYYRHIEARRAASISYKTRHKLRIAQYRRARMQENAKARLAHAEAQRRRTAQKKAQAVGVVSYDAILIRDGLWCHICSQRVLAEELSFDHVVPLARGGAHSMSNIRVAHRRCNSAKKAT